LRRSGSRRRSAAKKFLATDKICFTLGSAHLHCKKKTRSAAEFHPAARRRPTEPRLSRRRARVAAPLPADAERAGASLFSCVGSTGQ